MAFKFKQQCRTSPSAHTRGLAPNSGISQVKFLLQGRFDSDGAREDLEKSEIRSSKESPGTTTPSAGSLCYTHEGPRAFSCRNNIGANCKGATSLRLLRSYHSVGLEEAKVSNQD